MLIYYSFDNISWNKEEMQLIGNSTYTYEIKLDNAKTVYIYIEVIGLHMNVERTAVKEIHLESTSNLQLELIVLSLLCTAILIIAIVYRHRLRRA